MTVVQSIAGVVKYGYQLRILSFGEMMVPESLEQNTLYRCML